MKPCSAEEGVDVGEGLVWHTSSGVSTLHDTYVEEVDARCAREIVGRWIP